MADIINDRSMQRAAVVKAAGYPVNIYKLCSPRCVASYADTPAVRQLVGDYDAGKPIPISAKAIMAAYGQIMAQCRALKQGAI